jgi:hypothetical protein
MAASLLIADSEGGGWAKVVKKSLEDTKGREGVGSRQRKREEEELTCR